MTIALLALLITGLSAIFLGNISSSQLKLSQSQLDIQKAQQQIAQIDLYNNFIKGIIDGDTISKKIGPEVGYLKEGKLSIIREAYHNAFYSIPPSLSESEQLTGRVRSIANAFERVKTMLDDAGLSDDIVIKLYHTSIISTYDLMNIPFDDKDIQVLKETKSYGDNPINYLNVLKSQSKDTLSSFLKLYEEAKEFTVK